MKKYLLFIFSVSLISTGCLVGPKYNPPPMQAPENFANANSYINPNDSIVNFKWFNLFNDSVLTALIDSGLKNNYDLRIAVSRIEQANATYGFIKADQFPSFGYNANAGRTDQPNVPSVENPYNNFNLTATVGWEIDLWGKIRHAKRGALNDYLSTIEAEKSVRTQLVSDIASLYFQMRDVDNKINITRRTIKSRTESYTIIKNQFDKGYISLVDVLQVEQLLRDAEASLPNFERQLSFLEQSIEVLLGQPWEPIKRGIENTEQPLPPAIPSGLPSSLLQQRPDVKAAEYKYMAENERIGVAVAQRYPTFSLTGYLGLASPEISKLLTSDAATSQAFGSLLGPIYNFGKNKRRVEFQKKESEIAMFNYQKVYLVALSDVENALVSCKTLNEEYDARLKQATASGMALRLSQARYDNGYVSYLEVLDAERSLFSSELEASKVKQQQLNAYIQLYKALGGGW